MAKFLFIYRCGSDVAGKMTPEEMQRQMQKWQAWIGEGFQKGWLLDPGDSYYFESRFPHRFRNPSADEVCEVVSANSPPTF